MFWLCDQLELNSKSSILFAWESLIIAAMWQSYSWLSLNLMHFYIQEISRRKRLKISKLFHFKELLFEEAIKKSFSCFFPFHQITTTNFFRWHSFEWSGSHKKVLTISNGELTQGLKKWISFLNQLSTTWLKFLWQSLATLFWNLHFDGSIFNSY